MTSVRSAALVTTAAGTFGEQVLAFLAGRPGRFVYSPDQLDAAFSAGPEVVVVAMWRLDPGLCERADELAFRYGLPWLPAMMDHPHLRIGPFVIPGQSACFTCFQARRAQHDLQWHSTAALHAAYEHDPLLGPRGYLDYQARLAASLAELVLGIFGDGRPEAVAGRVISLNVLGSGIRQHQVIPRPGCVRCGDATAPARSALSELIGAMTAEGGPGAIPAPWSAQDPSDGRLCRDRRRSRWHS